MSDDELCDECRESGKCYGYTHCETKALRRQLAKSRNDALEEAAKVAEHWGQRKAQLTDTAYMPAADHGERFASNGIADRIRALKDKP